MQDDILGKASRFVMPLLEYEPDGSHRWVMWPPCLHAWVTWHWSYSAFILVAVMDARAIVACIDILLHDVGDDLFEFGLFDDGTPKKHEPPCAYVVIGAQI